MLTADLGLYIFWFVYVPLAGLTGFGAGRLTRGVVRNNANAGGVDVLNIGLGIVGCVAGAMLATHNASLYEEWRNGILVVHRVTGLIDYLDLLCFLGAMSLPVAAELLYKLIKNRRSGYSHAN